MKNIQKIFVPFDFSEISKMALRQALLLSLQNQATLVIFHALDRDAQEKISKLSPLLKDLESSVKNKIQLEIESLVSSSDKSKYVFEILVKIGKPAIEILLNAEKEKADLIVMGSHGHTGFKHLRLGSVAEKVVRHSGIPVLIHRGEIKAPKKILIPIDFSENSKEGFHLGLKWASDLNAEVCLLHVVGLQDIYSYKDLFTSIDSSLEDGLKKEAEEKLKDWTKEIQIPYRLEVRLGNTFLEIQAEIQDQKIDLVALATHGRTGLKHFLMGSIAEQVLRNSPCSVLTIRPAAFVQPALKFFENADEFDEYMKNCN